MTRPRQVSWLLFLVSAVFLFLAALQQSGAASGLPVWLEAAGLCSLAVGCFLWALPGQPPTVPLHLHSFPVTLLGTIIRVLSWTR